MSIVHLSSIIPRPFPSISISSSEILRMIVAVLNYLQIPIIVLRTIKGVVMNPVIFMTALGILVNVIISFGVHHGEHIDSDSKLPGRSSNLWLL